MGRFFFSALTIFFFKRLPDAHEFGEFGSSSLSAFSPFFVVWWVFLFLFVLQACFPQLLPGLVIKS